MRSGTYNISVLLCIFWSLFTVNTYAQEITVGLKYNTDLAFDGYTLFAPFNSFNTYLIDNCGNEVHRWSSDTRLGASVYLLDDGSLMRVGRKGGFFFGGGIAGIVEQFSWEGELLWRYEYANGNVHAHHDIEVLPNGNVLMIAWERKSAEEAWANGKQGTISGNGFWPDHIVEVKKTGPDSGEIVWEWHVWDHMIQDINPNEANYGIISEHPERIDINFGGNGPDWNHINAVDYNAELDQIMLSSRVFNELWVIDHSTTTEEAAGSSGGRYGKGGDLLYRFGNPMTYDQGTNFDQVFFGQHDTRWIDPGLPNESKIMAYNNGVSRSNIIIIEAPIDDEGNYSIEANEAFGPEEFYWTYDGDDIPFFSSRLSGAHELPNGNVLICVGQGGEFFEVTADHLMVWKYQNPVSNQILSQGDNPINTEAFRATKYSPNHPGLADRALIPIGPIELNPVDMACMLYSGLEDDNEKRNDLLIYPNFTTGGFYIEQMDNELLRAELLNSSGQLVKTHKSSERISYMDIGEMPQGFYYVILNRPNQQALTKKIVKQ